MTESEREEEVKRLTHEIDAIDCAYSIPQGATRKIEELSARRAALMAGNPPAMPRDGRRRRPGTNRLTDDDPPPSQVFIGSDRPSSRPGVPWMDAATGQPVRVARKGEVLYDVAHEFNEERRGLSIGKMIRGIAGGGWKDAELEKRALDESGSSGGQYLVPEQLWSEVIDKARAMSVLNQAGATTFEMTSDRLVVAQVLTDPTIGIVGEGATIPTSDLTIGQIGFTAKKIATIVSLSREVVQDSINAAALVEEVLVKALAVEIDRQGINGNGGATEMLGLTAIPGITETGSVGGILWDDIHNGATTVREANHAPTHYLVHPTIGGDLDLLKSGDGTNSAALWQGPPPSLDGVPRLVSTSCPVANAIIGNFSFAAFGVRNQASIETTTEAGDSFAKHQLWIKIWWRGDFGVVWPAAFHRLAGITS